jgi:hypothetical protein
MFRVGVLYSVLLVLNFVTEILQSLFHIFTHIFKICAQSLFFIHCSTPSHKHNHSTEFAVTPQFIYFIVSNGLCSRNIQSVYSHKSTHIFLDDPNYVFIDVREICIDHLRVYINAVSLQRHLSMFQFNLNLICYALLLSLICTSHKS